MKYIVLVLLCSIAIPALAENSAKTIEDLKSDVMMWKHEAEFWKAKDQGQVKAERDAVYEAVRRMQNACYTENGLVFNATCKEAIEVLNGEMYGFGEDFYCSQC